MKSLTWKLVLCALPIVVGAIVVGRAFWLYNAGEGGFNLGVDLVGGTILVYEVDQSRWPNGMPKEYSVEKLTAKLKQRIDPADLYNVRITPLSKTRIEIVLPTGGQKYAQHHEDEWQKLIDKVKDKWKPKEGEEAAYNVGLDQRQALIDAVIQQHSGDENFDPKEVSKFVNGLVAGRGEKRRSMTGEQVQRVKELISRVGSLKFVMLASTDDDKEGVETAQRYFDSVQNNEAELSKLRAADVTGAPPPPPTPPDHKSFNTDLGAYTYTWVELGPEERHFYGLANDQSSSLFWQEMAQARKDHKAVLHSIYPGVPYRNHLFYSREVTNPDRLPEKDRGKKYEYFILTRDPERDEDGRPKAVTGEYLVSAGQTDDPKRGGLAVAFNFNAQGAALLADLTTKNKGREMAIVLDDAITSAPNIENAITGGSGLITVGSKDTEEIDRLINILRSGALPATLKTQPVSENTMGATLGADTIKWGAISVVVAFVAILAFMLVYYRFAGLVACVALLANLLLTVALMVLINATFTLPGLAGLVLTLGMAVDANVLIYERLREERERGASLALAIRNGYDRAFAVIIDTHLSSIFTAIVLYVVGNDQLKGFGISLTLGLLISLFTSLFVTRTLFDLWLSRGWLHKLSMMKLFSKPNIDFMAIRNYWFTATIILTIIGAVVFFYRVDGHGGLNIDFTGGTKYSGLLKAGEGPQQFGLTIGQLRDDLHENAQREKLAVKEVKQLDDQGNYQIVYADDTVRDVYVNKDQDGKLVTPAEVKRRAQQLPDYAVEQIFARDYSSGDRSRLFTVRTQEMSPDLVQASIGRLLRDKDGNSLLQQTLLSGYTVSDDGKTISMQFSDFASPAQVQMLFEREFKRIPSLDAQAGQFVLERVGQEKEGHFKEMKLTLAGTGAVKRDAVEQAVKAVQRELAERPQPESLENFDSTLATDTQLRALYAILASWGAILLYLWFRFGSWTFGLAAVLCLIHDLFFTLGVIGLAHFIHQWWPNNFLLIQDFKLDLQSVAALLTLVGYSVNDTIVVFDRIREVRGKNPELTPKMINDSVNQTLSRTLLTALSVWLVVIVLYAIGGEGVHLFAFVMVVGVIVGTYSSIYIASPLLLIFGEGKPAPGVQRQAAQQPAQA
jgi:SecD/SecF fusion protein